MANINKNQVFLITIALTSIIAAWYLKDSDYWSAVILLIVTAVTFVLVWVYRSQKQPAQAQTVKREVFNSEREENSYSNKTEIIAPNTQTQKGLDGILVNTIDRFFSTAQVTGTITMNLPINKKIDYHGEQLEVKGNLEVKINGSTQTAVNQPQQAKYRMREVDS